jgi:hypothetical protein
MSGRSDERAANAEGTGHLRASHADRDQAVSVLKAAFVLGMLTKHEFDERIGQAIASRTHAELAALTVDIPAGRAVAKPLPEPQPAADKKALKAWACVTATFTAVAAVVAAATARSAIGLAEHELAVVIFVPVVAMVVGVLLLFHAWLDRRAGKRMQVKHRLA